MDAPKTAMNTSAGPDIADRFKEQGFACYVINLDDSVDRFKTLSKKLDASNIGFTRLSAFDGRGLDLSAVEDYDEKRARRYMGRGLVGGEIGCYYSHLTAARTFLEQGSDHCLVLEDDADPDKDLQSVVCRTIEVLTATDPDWRIVNLGNPKLRIFEEIAKIKTDRRSFGLCAAYYFPMTTGAILWSRKGAEDFVAGHGRIFAPVDNYFRHWITRAGGGYAVTPRPVPTSDAPSDIAQAQQKPRSRAGRSLLYGWRKQRRLMIDKFIALSRRYGFGWPR